jgi:dTDP-glucose pyrophosphorylase
MPHWRDGVVSPSASLRDTIAAMSDSSFQAAFVLDDGDVLRGIVTDGNVRKALLKDAGLDAPVTDVMTPSPRSIGTSATRAEALAVMRTERIHQLPVVDAAGRMVGLHTIDDLIGSRRRTTPVVVMAGGLGTRLAPLTDEVPKPMLRVGGKPILETIVEATVAQGFARIFVSLNYKAGVIEEHFGDGSRYGAAISYLHETERLGTAGALSLLPPGIDEPVVVMNGDLLTRISLDALLEFHDRERATATMVVREDRFQLPYGVVEVDGSRIVDVREKPSQRHLVNAGIYVVSPEAVARVPREEYYDMPSLFTRLAAEGRHTAAFPLHEYWIDVGRLDELERAQREWPRDAR